MRAEREAVILAIDPGKVSGAALFARGQLVWAITVTTAAGRHAAIADAAAAAEARGRRLIVVAERWQGSMRGKRRALRTTTGLGAAWGRWAEQLEVADHPKRRVVRVPPFEWHRVLPRSGLTAKARARMLCEAKWPGRAWTDDEAEAACIGLWAMRAPAVERLVLKRPAKRRSAET